MRAYFNTSVFLSCLLSIVYLLLMRAPFPMASDGNGPDGRAVLAYLVSILAWIVHGHTLVFLGFFYMARIKRGDPNSLRHSGRQCAVTFVSCS